MSLQKVEFLATEADAWYSRNKDHLTAQSPLREVVSSAIAGQLPGGGHNAIVLEIGCGRGDNLAALATKAHIEGHGIEPSRNAVEAGRVAYSALSLRCGTADALPYENEHFDAVWFGFCLYLVDRSLLARCVAEADRVLKDGGTLCIVDFDPGTPLKRAYHHHPGLWSYKMDYSALFLANPAYCLMQKISASHSGIGWHADPQERVGVWLCRKDQSSAYPSH